MTRKNTEAAPVRLRLNYLDGIRGLAALFVMLAHLWMFHFGIIDGTKGIAVNWLNYPHLAVDVFIVLSGYCLALPVSRLGKLKGGALAFFGRRARRILPPYYAAVVFSLILDFLVEHFGHHLITSVDSIFALHTILSNLFLVQDIWQRTNSIDGPLWSVALEWKIYFLFPILIWIWQRWRLPFVMIFSVIIGYGLTFLLRPFVPLINGELFCPWYVILFALGVCINLRSGKLSASVWKEKSGRIYSIAYISFVCLVVMLYIFPLHQTPGIAPIYINWLPLTDVFCGIWVACLLDLLAHAPAANILPKLLSNRYLVFIGTFSYSIYLMHIPLLNFIRGIVSHILGQGYSPLDLWVGTGIIGIPVVLSVSYLFHLAFERPFMSKLQPKTEREAEMAAIISPAP